MGIGSSFNISSVASNFTEHTEITQVRNFVLQSVSKYLVGNFSADSFYSMSYRFMSRGVAFIAGNNNVVWAYSPYSIDKASYECADSQARSSIHGSDHQAICYIDSRFNNSFTNLLSQLHSIARNYTLERTLRNKGGVIGVLAETVEGCSGLTASQMANIIIGEGNCEDNEIATTVEESVSEFSGDGLTAQSLVNMVVTSFTGLLSTTVDGGDSESSTDELTTQSPDYLSAGGIPSIIGAAVAGIFLCVGLGAGYFLGRRCWNREPSSKLESGESSSQVQVVALEAIVKS